MNECEKCDKPEGAIKQSIAKKAAVLCASLPDEVSCKNMADQKLASLLSATRSLMAECTLANNWDRAEAASYDRALALAEVAFEFATSAERDAAGCGRAKTVCREQCDVEDGGYFCYFDCRLEYVTCLASVVVAGRKE
jgi:hypothetical protein